MPSNEFNQDQVMSMQEDAMRRVREMHRRANERVRQSNQAIGVPAPPGNSPETPASRGGTESPRHAGGTSPPHASHHETTASPLKGLFEGSGFSIPKPGSLPFLQSAGTHGTPYEFNPLTLIKGMNPETMILLAMIVMLLNDGGDIKLILALCYLLF